jgi:hypothetical protein
LKEQSGTGERKREFSTADRWLMLALWLGPVAALSNLIVNDSLVAEACERGTKNLLHLITLGFVLIATGSALLARHHYKEAGRAEDALGTERTRWFALVAMLLSLASAVVIVAMEVPNVLLRSCL